LETGGLVGQVGFYEYIKNYKYTDIMNNTNLYKLKLDINLLDIKIQTILWSKLKKKLKRSEYQINNKKNEAVFNLEYLSKKNIDFILNFIKDKPINLFK